MTKGGVDSYYVWIPRFAYRITYYANETSTEVLGCWDGRGLYDAKTGTLNLENDEGIETTLDGEYIVHPAFGTNLDLGGWYDDDDVDDDGLTGFWVAKYEMSKSDATQDSVGSASTFSSRPNVVSARNMTIGNIYEKSKLIDSNKESHLIKNSEWGAVALLTHSQYGRNGNEIYINNSKKYITGNGGDTKNADISEGKDNTKGIVNEYNTEKGVLASTTGNIYGIYDMSGGAWEYVAALYGDSEDINSSYAGAMITNTEALNPDYNEETSESVPKYISTKYITVYRDRTSNIIEGNTLFNLSKIGDAIKEVKKKSITVSWYEDRLFMVDSDDPFFARGCSAAGKEAAGVFSSKAFNGNKYGSQGFRVAICVNN